MHRIIKTANFNNATHLEQETIRVLSISLLNLAFYLLGITAGSFEEYWQRESPP